MGFFDCFCSVSRLALQDETALILISKKGDAWEPIALPFFNSYDRYGSIDTPTFDASGKAILDFYRATTETKEPNAEEAFAKLVDTTKNCLDWTLDGDEKKLIRYALVHAGVFRGIVATVAKDKKKWPTPVQGSWDELFAHAFPIPETSKRVYESLKKADKEKLAPALLDLARFRAFGAKLEPLDYEDSDQFCGYRGDFGTQQFCEAARTKFKDYPLILEAVEANAEGWRSLDEDE